MVKAGMTAERDKIFTWPQPKKSAPSHISVGAEKQGLRKNMSADGISTVIAVFGAVVVLGVVTCVLALRQSWDEEATLLPVTENRNRTRGPTTTVVDPMMTTRNRHPDSDTADSSRKVTFNPMVTVYRIPITPEDIEARSSIQPSWDDAMIDRLEFGWSSREG